MDIAEGILNCLFVAFLAASFIAAALRPDPRPQRHAEVFRWGVEVEAEILGRFEAGAPQGSELAKGRQMMMASWDPLELELRYVFDGREIVSRGQVSTEIFFRTRGLKTLKIQVSPSEPERWAAIARSTA